MISKMDVINLISKVDGLPDAPIVLEGQPYQPASIYFANGCAFIRYPCAMITISTDRGSMNLSRRCMKKC